MSRDEIEEALQQMTGFKIGRYGGDVRELISSMGLEKDEWLYIKKNENSGHLDEDTIKEIDEYFAISENQENNSHPSVKRNKIEARDDASLNQDIKSESSEVKK